MRFRRNWSSLRTIAKARKASRPAVDGTRIVLIAITVIAASLIAALIIGWWLDVASVEHFRKSGSVLARVSGKLTDLGKSFWYLVPAALICISAGLFDWKSFSGAGCRRASAWTCAALLVLLSVGISGLIVTVLKYVIARARPGKFEQFGAFHFDPFSFVASFTSFPSGHASTMAALATLCVLLYPRISIILVPFALFIGTMRVYVGWHYPSDVAVGFGIGCATTLLVALAFARCRFVFRIDEAGRLRRRRTFKLTG